MTAPPEDVRVATRDAIRAHMLIHAFRVRGHTEADLEPLGLREVASHPDLDRPLELPLPIRFAQPDALTQRLAACSGPWRAAVSLESSVELSVHVS